MLKYIVKYKVKYKVMSATNQVQNSTAGYYLNQYEDVSMVFTSSSGSGDHFTCTLRFHKLGNQVIVNVIEASTNSGATVGIARYESTTAVPLKYKPTTGSNALGFVACVNPTNLSQASYMIIDGTGFCFVYPATGALFIAGSNVYGGYFQYFI